MGVPGKNTRFLALNIIYKMDKRIKISLLICKITFYCLSLHLNLQKLSHLISRTSVFIVLYSKVINEQNLT